MSQENYSHISKYARHFFSGTLLSRISGMIRDVSMAAVFGDHPSVAAFMVAFRFSHFLRRLLGEGTLQSILIPRYEELKILDEQKANGFFFRLYLLMTLGLTCLILGVETILRFVFPIFSNGNEILSLFAILFPSLLFISLYGLNLSLLQCKSSFFSSSVAPLGCNAIWIAAVFLFANKPPAEAMVYLSVFTLVGFIVQWMITLPKTSKTLISGYKNTSSPLLSAPTEVRSLGKAAFFGLLGVAAVQINSFVDMLFAGFADPSGPVYLWYAVRLYQLPLALIGFACIYSITPSIARAFKAGDLLKTQNLFSFGLKRIKLLVIPCTFAVFALGYSSVNLLFGRGQFSEDAVMKTTYCLLAYGAALLPSTLVIYRSSLFYAEGDSKTPMWGSILSIVLNVALNAVCVFVFHLGAISVAIGTSVSAFANYFILESLYMKKNPGKISSKTGSVFLKISLVGLLSYVACTAFDPVFFRSFPPIRSLSYQLSHFLSLFSVFTITFTLSLRLLYKELYILIKGFVFSKQTESQGNF